jgi:hypothetical protein
MRKEKRKTNLGRPVRTESTANQSQQIVGRPNKDLGGGRWLLYTDQVGVKQLPSDRQILYADQVGGYRAPHTPARAVWAGLVGPVRVVFLFFVIFLFYFFFFSFSFSFLFLFLFCSFFRS